MVTGIVLSEARDYASSGSVSSSASGVGAASSASMTASSSKTGSTVTGAASGKKSADACEGGVTVDSNGYWTYTNSKKSIREVKVIKYDPNPNNYNQEILCGVNYAQQKGLCTSGSWKIPVQYGYKGCMMVQIDYNGGCNSKDPVFCFK
ncbi:hypothetical protein F751_1444 [Auxenochlorella protothecoides]|uniref:Uncharacterized protein n=1 Tax=Auxenochlorella protothecoides TaxID=3075 RepID=A0A087SJC6_AUXPR|nr:hypothetical protein F751_1444 [Auxenochlorella protothecoides]KFM25830.1 hypothetical protein F751_1444 [Auxenochlorella protothecoides]